MAGGAADVKHSSAGKVFADDLLNASELERPLS